MEPIPEAVAWAERADAWAQRPPEGDNEQNPRWSDLASTGRPAFPADGVGWRTETAEWRATEQTARWRQTTEWRSASGTHGWRSTTEAWQTGAGAEGFRPPVDPQTRQQLAISGTAWSSDDEQPIEATPTRPQPGDEPTSGAASWQRFTEGPAPDNGRPAWQQFAGPPAPWQQGTPSAPWDPPGGPSVPRQGGPRSPEQPSWQQLVEPTDGPPRSGPADRRAGWQSFTDQPPSGPPPRDDTAGFNGFISSNGATPSSGAAPYGGPTSANGSTPYGGTDGYGRANGSSPRRGDGRPDGLAGYGASPYDVPGGPTGYGTTSANGAAPASGPPYGDPRGTTNGASPYGGPDGPSSYGGTEAPGYRGTNGASPYGGTDGPAGYGGTTSANGSTPYGGTNGTSPYGGTDAPSGFAGGGAADGRGAPWGGANGTSPYGGDSPYGGAGGSGYAGGSAGRDGSGYGSSPGGGGPSGGGSGYESGSAPYGGGGPGAGTSGPGYGSDPDRSGGGYGGAGGSGAGYGGGGAGGSGASYGGGGAGYSGPDGGAGYSGAANGGGRAGYGSAGYGAPDGGGTAYGAGGASYGGPDGSGGAYGGGGAGYGGPFGNGAAYGAGGYGGSDGSGASYGGGGAGYSGSAAGSYAETATRAMPFDAGRHLVREDDRAQWRALAEEQRPTGRRRAAEPGLKTSGGTGWSTRSDSDHWAGHTDTGSMEVIDDTGVTDAPSWRSRSDSWRESVEESSDWRSTGDSWSAVPGTDRRNGRNPEDRQQIGWRPADQEQDDRPGRRSAGRRAADPDVPSWQRSGPAAIGWQPEERGQPDDYRQPDEYRQPDQYRQPNGYDRPEGYRQANGYQQPGSYQQPDGYQQPDEHRRPDDWRRSADDDRGGPASWQRSAPPAIGWQQPDERRPDDGRRTGAPDEQRRGAADDVRGPASWQRSGPAAIGWREDVYQRDEDQRDDGRANGARRDAVRNDWDDTGGRDTSSWRQDPRWQQEHDRDDDRPRRRRDAEPVDPWAQGAAETSVIPLPLPPDDGRRPGSGAIGRARPMNPNRRRDEPRMAATGFETRPGETRPDDTGTRVGRRRAEPDGDAGAAPIDPEVFRREPGTRSSDANWPAEDAEPAADWRRDLQGDGPPGEAATEIRPWQQEERDQAERGTASYRGGNTGDWRRELAAETSTNLADGESRRFGTQDFVPFKPVGAASVPPPTAASASAPPISPAGPARPREELLVGSSAGGAADAQWPPRQSAGFQNSATGAYERRSVTGGLASAPGRPNSGLLEPDEDDEIEEDTGGPLAAVGYTVIWYGVPVVLFVLYMLVLNGSQQAHALSTLADAAPQFGLSLVLSMLVAVGLRWASGSWKAASVGLAAAVMGGGIATVLTSAITGQSLS